MCQHFRELTVGFPESRLTVGFPESPIRVHFSEGVFAVFISSGPLPADPAWRPGGVSRAQRRRDMLYYIIDAIRYIVSSASH